MGTTSRRDWLMEREEAMTTSVEPTCCSCCVIPDEPVPAAVEPKAGAPKMSSISRLVLAVAALALGLLFVLPLWHIGLKAPQYPEGLGLYIAINRIQGAAPQDLNSINNLNHYIGMKQIRPDDIPELRYMPWMVLGLIATGLGVAALKAAMEMAGYAGGHPRAPLAPLSQSEHERVKAVMRETRLFPEME